MRLYGGAIWNVRPDRIEPTLYPLAEIAGLKTEVRKHDPRIALDGGSDGLDAYRVIAPGAKRLLARGALVLEVGFGQSDDVQHLMRAAGLTPKPSAKADLAGIPRAVASLKLPP